MKRLILTMSLVAVCGIVSAGEIQPAQKSDVAQKSAVQKTSAAQKGEASISLGFFGRLRAARLSRIEARQAGWAAFRSARLCSTGGCN